MKRGSAIASRRAELAALEAPEASPATAPDCGWVRPARGAARGGEFFKRTPPSWIGLLSKSYLPVFPLGVKSDLSGAPADHHGAGCSPLTRRPGSRADQRVKAGEATVTGSPGGPRGPGPGLTAVQRWRRTASAAGTDHGRGVRVLRIAGELPGPSRGREDGGPVNRYGTPFAFPGCSGCFGVAPNSAPIKRALPFDGVG